MKDYLTSVCTLSANSPWPGMFGYSGLGLFATTVHEKKNGTYKEVKHQINSKVQIC